MDETLLEHTQSFEELGYAIHHHFQSELVGVARDEFWETYWEKTVDLWFMMFDGVIDGVVARSYSFINTLRTLKMNESLFDEMVRVADEHILAATRLFDDTMPVLKRIRDAGITTGIVTNGYTQLQRLKLNHHGLCDLVDFTLVSEEAGAHKPDPRIFQQALAKTEASVSECLFVGDMPDADIKGAHAVGMPSALIDAGGKWANLRTATGAPKATFTIKRLGELLPILGLDALRG